MRRPAVTTTLNYMGPMKERPTVYACPPPAGVPERNIVADPRNVPIHDARLLSPEPTLSEMGFALGSLAVDSGRVREDEWAKQYAYEKVEDLVCSLTGASRVVVFDHTFRSRDGVKRTEQGVREPVFSVHNDYTNDSARARVKAIVGGEAVSLLGQRTRIVNVWQPLVEPIEDVPLAICDIRTMHESDFVPIDLIYKDRVGNVQGVQFHSRHRWYFFSAMGTAEALVFVCYDSDRAHATSHSAFQNPQASPSAPPRQSIEFRTMVFA